MLEASSLTGRVDWPWPGIPEHKSLSWQNWSLPVGTSLPPSHSGTLGLGTAVCQVGVGVESFGYVGSYSQQPLSRLSSDSAPDLAKPWVSGSVENLFAREREKL